MTQQAQALVSGQNVLQGYAQNGVFTPAQGLQEFVYIKLDLPVVNTWFVYALNNALPLRLVQAFVNLDNSSGQEREQILRHADFEYKLMLKDSEQYHVPETPTIVMETDASIELKADANLSVVSAKHNVILLCQRVALLSTIETAGE